jgi:hypothetical protein
MKRNIILFCGIALFAPLQAMAYLSTDTASWTSTSASSFVQNGDIINVTYPRSPVRLQPGSSVTEKEGNGLIQFTGSNTDIAFDTPNHENHYGAKVDGPRSVASAVPVPAAVWLMLSGLIGVLGLLSRKSSAE